MRSQSPPLQTLRSFQEGKEGGKVTVYKNFAGRVFHDGFTWAQPRRILFGRLLEPPLALPILSLFLFDSAFWNRGHGESPQIRIPESAFLVFTPCTYFKLSLHKHSMGEVIVKTAKSCPSLNLQPLG